MRIVIVGAGEVGFHIAERLAFENKEVVVVDKNPEALKRVSEHLDVQTVEGSGSSPGVLERAGLKESDILLAVTDSDEANLIVCFFARSIAPKALKVARIRNEEYSSYLGRDGLLDISLVINPDVEVVNSILRIVSAPGAVEVNEFADGRISMVGKRLPAESALCGINLMQLPELTGGVRVIVAAVLREERLIIPRGTDRLFQGDLVYFVCEKRDLNKVMEIFGSRVEPIRDIMIVGGGKIGLRLARELEKRHISVKLVEKSMDRSLELSAILDRTIVLHGDGTDHEILTQENVGAMDMVMALTGDEETNILTTLLARRLGAKRAVVRVNKLAYIRLVQAMGIENIVSPRLSAIHSILRHIRSGRIISTVSIKGEDAEVMEALALEGSDIVGRPLKSVRFPREALLLTIVRAGEVVIPHGDTVIQPQDRVIVLTSRQALPKVERVLAGKR
ncbi:Trk system potassium transporter TrkA [Desulfocurvibacter africanus]|uniref:Trk system potassium uptake protein TrkA n=1 Tax=Desulfocurvibacter africanus subsp. africanus str. Walvis Bay TaxID=690850 RepID=F3YU45_DESAF|nr:Trk system potassium transporter TrkA [Desulfocurvibacter africanus]EGJ48651.1 TrkA-N domain protein [Desulfocurvibacter africanus subsp. africanus str. Walvis Bay]